MSLYLPCSLSFLLTVRLSLSLSRFLFPCISLSLSLFLPLFSFFCLSRFSFVRCVLFSLRSPFFLLDLPFRHWPLPGKAVSLFTNSSLSLYSLHWPEIRRARAGWMLSEIPIVDARLFSCSCCICLSVEICMHARYSEIYRRVLCAD